MKGDKAIESLQDSPTIHLKEAKGETQDQTRHTRKTTLLTVEKVRGGVARERIAGKMISQPSKWANLPRSRNLNLSLEGDKLEW